VDKKLGPETIKFFGQIFAYSDHFDVKIHDYFFTLWRERQRLSAKER
jgi:hypothetical protein